MKHPLSLDQFGSLALNAATEIDRLLRGREYKREAISDFVGSLQEFSNAHDERLPMGQLALDPTSSEMFSAAVKRATERKVENLSQLKSELEELVRNIGNGDTERGLFFDQFKKFCLAVHEFTLRNAVSAGLTESGVFEHERVLA